jgi:REP element-mobilizing transposase RayT
MATPATNRERQRPGRATYLITFTCYGAHLHGEEGTIDRDHNVPGTPAMYADDVLLEQSKGLMTDHPYLLDAPRRAVVLDGIKDVCTRRRWGLLAAHVRTNHVHAVVVSERPPEQIMIALKAYASRWLNEIRIDTPDRRRWTRHGSTRYLSTREQIEKAIQYVVGSQGSEMAVFSCAS